MFQYDELIAAGFTGFKTVKQMNNGGLDGEYSNIDYHDLEDYYGDRHHR